MRKMTSILVVGSIALSAIQVVAADSQTEALVMALHNPNSRVRSRAAMTLALKGPIPKEAMIALIARLEDRNLNVRYWAASALRRMGPEAAAAVPALIKALKTFPGGVPELEGPHRYYADVRVVAAQALGSIGFAARAAIPALQEASRDENRSVREAALEAIKAIAPQQ